MSTKQLMVSSVFDGKENSILRKENNKTILTYKNCQGGMAKNTSNMLCCPFFNFEDLFATALIPFFLLLCPLCGLKN